MPRNAACPAPPVRMYIAKCRNFAMYRVPVGCQKRHIEVNPCEIHENFHRKPNAMHRPVIYRSVKPLHRTAAYPFIPYVLTQNDKTDRVLLRTGHHGRKSEQICGTADFSPQSVHSSLTQKPMSRKYGGKKLMKSNLYSPDGSMCALRGRQPRYLSITACFTSLRSVQGSASLALPMQLSQRTSRWKPSADADNFRRKV